MKAIIKMLTNFKLIIDFDNNKKPNLISIGYS